MSLNSKEIKSDHGGYPELGKPHMAGELFMPIYGYYPVRTYTLIAKELQRLHPGQFYRTKRVFQSEKGSKTCIVDIYPQGLPTHHDISGILNDPDKKLTKFCFREYIESTGFREQHPEQLIEEIVALDMKLDKNGHKNRFMDDKLPTDEYRKYFYRTHALTKYTLPSSIVMMIRDTQTLELVGLRVGLRDPKNLQIAEAAIEVDPENRMYGIASHSLRDISGIFYHLGIKEIKEDFSFKNRTCFTLWSKYAEQAISRVNNLDINNQLPWKITGAPDQDNKCHNRTIFLLPPRR